MSTQQTTSIIPQLQYNNYEDVIKVCNVGGKKETYTVIANSIGWRVDYQDNGFCQGELTDIGFEKAIKRGIRNKTNIFFAHDYKPLYKLDVLQKHFDIVICPVHNIQNVEQIKSEFEWFGYVTRTKGINRRKYSFKSFKDLTHNKKRWSMGWRSLEDLTIVEMDGFDTTIPSSKSRFGQIVFPNGIIYPTTKKQAREMRFKKTCREMIISSFFNINLYLRKLFDNYNKGVLYDESEGTLSDFFV